MSDQTELARIRSCLHVAVEQTGIPMTTGEAVRIAAAFQEAMNADGMAMLWQSDVDRMAAELEPKP